MFGDWARLRQMAWQLLANALKFTPRGGSVAFGSSTSDQDAVLEVSDTGPGIDPAFLPRIFDRFTQEDASSTRTAGGLGVGLSLVREIVELHGGKIAAANNREEARRDLHGEASAPAGEAGAVTRPLSARDHRERLTAARRRARARPRPRSRGARALETVLQQRGALVRTTDRLPKRSSRWRAGGPTFW